jgi:hypothetical protein
MLGVARSGSGQHNGVRAHLCYALADDAHLCVVVAPAGGAERFAVTAYFSRTIKKGKGLWTS